MLPVLPPLNAMLSSHLTTPDQDVPKLSRFNRLVLRFKGVSSGAAVTRPMTSNMSANAAFPAGAGASADVAAQAVPQHHPQRRPSLVASGPDMVRDAKADTFLKREDGNVGVPEKAPRDQCGFVDETSRRLHGDRLTEHAHPDRVMQLRRTKWVTQRTTALHNDRAAVEIIRRVMKTDEDAARRFLAHFQCDEDGPFGRLQLALHFEKHGRRPAWAEKRQSKAPLRHASMPVAHVRPQTSVRRGYVNKEETLGKFIAGGVRGIVYQDKTDNEYVIKRFKWRVTPSHREAEAFSDIPSKHPWHPLMPVGRRLNSAQEEARLFCRYYGEGAAEVMHDDHDVYVRMRRIPGVPIRHVEKFPGDAIERFVDMLGHLNAAGVMHGDLHSGNILYHADGKRFFPVDLSNIRSRYFAGTANDKRQSNDVGDYLWYSVVKEIVEKMRPEDRRGIVISATDH